MITAKDLQKLVKDISVNDEIKITEIPDFDIYIGQVTRFLSEKLSHLKRSEEDKILTATMINNYTKDNLLLKPINGKKYNKNHIILMILLYHLKQILSLDDIKSIFEVILKDMSTTDDDVVSLEDIYSIFVDLRDDELNSLLDGFLKNHESVKTKMTNMNITISEDLENEKEKAEWFLLVISLVAQAHANKRLAESIIDKYLKPT